VRILLLAAAVLLTACQQPPAPPPVTSAVSPVAQLRAEGDALMARGDHAGAVEKFRQAIDLEPSSVPLRFALGIAYSFLDRRPEAIAQLRWVVASASPESTEYLEARRWLTRVGVVVESPPVAVKSDPAVPEAVKKVDPAGQGWVAGQAQWPRVSPAEQPVPIRIALAGAEDATRQVGMRRNISLGERFEFKDVPEGQYRLVGSFEDQIIWDQRITVKGGKQTDVTLTQGTSTVPPDTFPPSVVSPTR
jgi:tetratricopeptide (TPR) repeat protein